jgi:putative NADH-flavin reductase
MKLIIFGSTGSVGKHLVTQAHAAGHTVTAFARDTSKLRNVNFVNLRLFDGNVLDQKAVTNAIAGQDVVLCALGAGRKGNIRSQGTRNIIAGMKLSNVRRLICQTTLGAGDSYGTLNFFWKRIMFGWFLKEAFLDHQLQEQYVKDSDLDWTIVRPAAFTDGPMTGIYKHGFKGTEKNITLKISRSDVAHFMLLQLTSSAYLKRTPGLSY